MNGRNNSLEIIDGRISTRSLEVHIADHCNLRCADCCSLSPLLSERFVEPKMLERDLMLATAVLSPTYVKLVGGEPLLHPQIIECLKAARPKANLLSVTTNGILLDKMNVEFWELIDALTISIYPTPKLHAKLMDDIYKKADQFNVTLNIKNQETFVEMTQWDNSSDTAATKEIYSNCWLRERCHIVDKGRFYQCTRPPHFHTFYNGKKDFQQDGVILHKEPSLLQEIAQYLTRTEPLKSCFNCKGGDAKVHPHRMLSSKEISQILELKS